MKALLMILLRAGASTILAVALAFFAMVVAAIAATLVNLYVTGQAGRSLDEAWITYGSTVRLGPMDIAVLLAGAVTGMAAFAMVWRHLPPLEPSA